MFTIMNILNLVTLEEGFFGLGNMVFHYWTPPMGF